MMPRAAWIAIAAFVLLLPWSVWLYTPVTGHDGARIGQLLLGLVCALACLRRRASLPAPRAWAWAFAAAAAVSIGLAADRWHAALEAGVLLGGVAIAWAVAAASWPRLRQAALALTVLAMAWYSAFGLLMAGLGAAATGHVDPAALTAGYDNVRFFNHVQVVTLPLLAAAVLSPGARWQRFGAVFALVVGWAVVWATGARATTLAMGLALLVVGLRLPGLRRPWMVVMIGSAALGLLVHAGLFVHGPQAPGLAEPPAAAAGARLVSDQSRFLLWRLAWEQFLAAPWFGAGPMQFAAVPNPKAAHPHSAYLQVLAEWGLVVAVCLSVLVMRGARALWRAAAAARDADDAPIAAGLLAAGAGLLVDAAFSGNLVMPMSQVWIALWAGCALAFVRHADAPVHGAAVTVPPLAGARATALALGLICGQVGLLAAVAPQALHLKEHLRAVQDKVPNPKTNPRFWSHGWI